MKVFSMTRTVPEIIGGPTELSVQEQDIPILEARGWVKMDSGKTEPTPKTEVEDKEEMAEVKTSEKKTKGSKNK